MSDLGVAGALFLLVMVTHGLSRNITPFDSRWVVFSALSLLHKGDLNLNEYQPLLEKSSYYAIECVGPAGAYRFIQHDPREAQKACSGDYYNYYPLAVPVLTAPVLWGVEAAATVSRPVWRMLEPHAGSRRALVHALAVNDLGSIAIFVELGAACLFVSLASALVYLFCRGDLPPAWAAGLALVFAFATPAWSTGSRALWQHTLAMPLLAVAMWLLSAARRRPELAAWAGIPLMTAFWVRPTNVVSLAVFTVYVLACYRRQLPLFLAGMIPPAVLFGAITYSIYGAPFAPYASAGRAAGHLSLHEHFWLAVAGNLGSPARGLLVFMPFLALAAFAWPPSRLGRARTTLHWAALAVVAGNTLIVSSFVDWWGGHCFGPRFYADLCPLLILATVPLAMKISSGDRRLAACAAVLVACAFFIHWRGADEPVVLEWNTKPVEIRAAQWRLWDWSDLSFLRGWH